MYINIDKFFEILLGTEITWQQQKPMVDGSSEGVGVTLPSNQQPEPASQTSWENTQQSEQTPGLSLCGVHGCVTVLD